MKNNNNLQVALNDYINDLAQINNTIDLDAVAKGAIEFANSNAVREYHTQEDFKTMYDALEYQLTTIKNLIASKPVRDLDETILYSEKLLEKYKK